jgi:hypothetical protein
MKPPRYGPRWDVVSGLTGSLVVRWPFQSQWVVPDPELGAGALVAAIGAAGLIVAQPTSFPARA